MMKLSAFVRFADVSVDLFTRYGERAGVPFRLRGKELDILLYLAQRPWEPVHRWDLYADVIGRMPHIDSNTLEVQVCRLRETLGEPLRAPVLVVTTPFGYMLAADVELQTSFGSVTRH